MSFLTVVIKGKVPTDLNNPTGNMTNGGFWQYALTKDGSGAWQLAQDYTAVEAPLPFSINEDYANPGTFVASDVAMGYDVAMLSAQGGQSKVGVIPNQAAVSATLPCKIVPDAALVLLGRPVQGLWQLLHR